jgi:choline monooxygenase
VDAESLASGLTLPAGWYSDPAVLRLEQERIFRRVWVYAGRTEQVAEPGQFFTARSGDVPIVCVRGSDGELRAFVNVCRHRASVLVEGEGRRETIQCGYHAWTYNLDGSLRSAPRSEREDGFSKDGLGLIPAAIDTWGPFVFVNPSAEAAPLEETLGELPALVAEGGVDVDALAFRTRFDFDVEANWKVACENFLECYHCPTAHPDLAQIIDVNPDSYLLEVSETFSSQYAPVRENPKGSYDPSGEIERGQFHFLWPNTVVNIQPGRPNLSIGPIFPAGPERASRFLDYFFAPDADEAWVEELLAFDGRVSDEDAALVASVQRGLRSGMIEHGRLLPRSEALIHDFQVKVAAALG